MERSKVVQYLRTRLAEKGAEHDEIRHLVGKYLADEAERVFLAYGDFDVEYVPPEWDEAMPSDESLLLIDMGYEEYLSSKDGEWDTAPLARIVPPSSTLMGAFRSLDGNLSNEAFVGELTKLAEAARKNRRDSEALFFEALGQLRLRQDRRSILSLLKQALALQPMNPWILELKGILLSGMNQLSDALAAYDEILKLYGEAAEETLAELVAKVHNMRGMVLQRMARIPEALEAYEKVMLRFGRGKTRGLREAIGIALFSKGRALEKMDSEAALVAYDEVVNRFGESLEPMLRPLVAGALDNKRIVLKRLNRVDEARAVFSELLRRFGDAKEVGIKRLVERAQNAVDRDGL
jgi:tetratricopeptide (TPR) repeat protein